MNHALCRNPRCRQRMPAVDLSQDQFCTRNCFEQFYRRHCLVCEDKIRQPKRGHRIICGRLNCKIAARTFSSIYRPFSKRLDKPATPLAAESKSTQETPILSGSKLGNLRGRANDNRGAAFERLQGDAVLSNWKPGPNAKAEDMPGLPDFLQLGQKQRQGGWEHFDRWRRAHPNLPISAYRRNADC
jgi:hypothetical protein